ncbi:MAG: sigma-E processing peptidase SpoIIGA [Lachnospiraceae bacterium]|nr:sigma-E processing peptidase SpoIIGA [Lachnospiraceae bacterium]
MIFEIDIGKVFIINLVLNIFILILTARTLKLSATKLRILAGGVFGALGYCLALPLPVTYPVKVFIGLVPVSLLMIKLTFKSQGIKNILRQTGFLFIYAFLTGAVILFLQRQITVFGLHSDKVWLVLVLGYTVFALSDYFLKLHHRNQENVFLIVFIPCEGKEIEVTALVDTGNGLTEPVNGKPVTILEEAVWQELKPLMKPEKTKAIPYHNIGNAHGMMIGYEISEIYIEKSGQKVRYENVIVAVGPGKISGSGKYQMILNPQLFKKVSPGGDTSKRTQAFSLKDLHNCK